MKVVFVNLPSVNCSEYPGLICGCQIVWMRDWPKKNLLGEASYYVSKHKLGNDCETDVTYVYSVQSTSTSTT